MFNILFKTSIAVGVVNRNLEMELYTWTFNAYKILGRIVKLSRDYKQPTPHYYPHFK